MSNTPLITSEAQIKRVSRVTLLSLLNLTFLPAIAFIWLVIEYKKPNNQPLEVYYLRYSIKLNLTAAFALGFVSVLMVVLGGFNSAWTWVYVITYFTFVHTVFILMAVWAMTRAWSGKKLKSETLSKDLL